ncbi:hypothetical protein CU014_0957 [Enterococcus xinjiangensis]|nr:hypothetical protein [Enterococcus lactis]MBL4997125.1 hypothetical protein [Enterococcus lactis]
MFIKSIQEVFKIQIKMGLETCEGLFPDWIIWHIWALM